ncbi:hypothetical protein H4R33_000783 [Dimargaris cristalligena]|uniref:Intimal thickness related receptor IRP domain-containing protein n=1 Tax=Dimargaris cristalligena TaxID=215637 RepID=A0A4P9ZQN3_9FUNG|nr:hypothetical protein H4R33_000783 [Dimargaris cristalligena]RKP35428.1 hypothetical protein BJ085DRAFT_30060 [Dimargaris cristalligena]|eukprot:RKP35428.1 hypothetical protein BJ085DRAFT_30060 [Dimargaris cristalligena]
MRLFGLSRIWAFFLYVGLFFAWYPPAGADITIRKGDIKLHGKLWDFFGDIHVENYRLTGLVIKAAVRRGCKLTPPTKKYKVGLNKFESTIIFVYFRTAKYTDCFSFTDLIKQMEEYRYELVQLGYPTPQLAIFNCRRSFPEPFGSPDMESPDDYFDYKPKQFHIALVGSDTGQELNSLLTSSGRLVRAEVVQDRGPWNTLLKSPGWLILKSVTYAAHSSITAYGLFQLYLLYQIQGFKINIRVAVISISLFYLLVNGILQYGELQRNVGYITIYISWGIGSIAFNLVIIVWIRAFQKIERGSFTHIMYVVIVCNVSYMAFMCVVFITSMKSHESWIMSATQNWSFVQPLLCGVEGMFLLYFGARAYLVTRDIRDTTGTYNAFHRMTVLCFLAFIGYTFQAVAYILMNNNGRDYVSHYILKYICYRLSTIILYGSLLWVLRLDGSLSEMHWDGDDSEYYDGNDTPNTHSPPLSTRRDSALYHPHTAVAMPPSSGPATATASLEVRGNGLAGSCPDSPLEPPIVHYPKTRPGIVAHLGDWQAHHLDPVESLRLPQFPPPTKPADRDSQLTHCPPEPVCHTWPNSPKEQARHLPMSSDPYMAPLTDFFTPTHRNHTLH